jgi:hypothetical protein
MLMVDCVELHDEIEVIEEEAFSTASHLTALPLWSHICNSFLNELPDRLTDLPLLAQICAQLFNELRASLITFQIFVR